MDPKNEYVNFSQEALEELLRVYDKVGGKKHIHHPKF